MDRPAGIEMRAETTSLPGRRPGGFSMIELMTVIAIGVILLGIAIPSFYALIQRQKITTVANEFFVAINLARSEAIRRSTRVDLVPAGDGSDWTKGWLVFIDENRNQRPDAGEEIIFSHGPVPKGIAIQASFTDSTVQYLAYTGTGRTRTNASSQAPQLGTLTFATDGEVRQIKINFLGRARVCNPAADKSAC